MNFDDLLNQFSLSYGTSLSFDERGICRFLVNENIALSIEKTADEKGFFLYAVLTEIPQGQENVYALTALDGNLFGKEMNGSSIGYDQNSNSLILFRYFDGARTEKNDFTEGFNAFLQGFAYWTAKLKTLPR